MKQRAGLCWLTKCSASALVLLLACAIAAARFGDKLQLPATTTRDGSLVTLNRYMMEPIPDVVLVGSSLTFRLKEEYFELPSVRNLALAGGSPLTGLEIVAAQPRLPKIILVEMNVLSRSVDKVLVGRYAGDRRVAPMFLRPLRSAVALYENWMHAPLSRADSVAELHRLLARPPSGFDNHIYVERAVSQLESDDPSAAARMNVEQIRRLIPLLEQRGARVLLFELPYEDRVEDTRSAKITHAIVHAAFPGPDRWLQIGAPEDELRWADGVHLDERSAAIVVQAVEKALRRLKSAT